MNPCNQNDGKLGLGPKPNQEAGSAGARQLTPLQARYYEPIGKKFLQQRNLAVSLMPFPSLNGMSKNKLQFSPNGGLNLAKNAARGGRVKVWSTRTSISKCFTVRANLFLLRAEANSY